MSIMRNITPFLLVVIIFIVTGCDYKETYYRGPVSDHYDGKEFHNTTKSKPVVDMFRIITWTTKTLIRNLFFKKAPAQIPHAEPNPLSPANKITVTFINHVTFLIQYNDKNILTDPVWADYAGPSELFSVPRVKSPGVEMENLPHIDYVLISHNHYDHMDLNAIKNINDKYKPHFFVGLGNCYYLNYVQGINAKCTEMDWWHNADPSEDTKITFVPASHWSGRSYNDRNQTLWGGFVVTVNGKDKIFFAGDTAYGSHFEDIGRKFGNFRIALLPIGAYKPEKFLKNSHMSPMDSVKVHGIIRSNLSLGMHFGTFTSLSEETPQEAIEDLYLAMKNAKLNSNNFKVLEHGEHVTINMTP